VNIVPLAFLGITIMRAHVPRLAAMVSGVSVLGLFVTDRCRSCSALDGRVKAGPTSPAHPLPIMRPRPAWVRDHHAVVKPGADWPEGI